MTEPHDEGVQVPNNVPSALVQRLRAENDALQRQVDNLNTALKNSREIGAAVGILMATRMVTYDAGFQQLQTVSQVTNRKLREVAADVVTTGALPPNPDGNAYPLDHQPQG